VCACLAISYFYDNFLLVICKYMDVNH